MYYKVTDHDVMAIEPCPSSDDQRGVGLFAIPVKDLQSHDEDRLPSVISSSEQVIH